MAEARQVSPVKLARGECNSYANKWLLTVYGMRHYVTKREKATMNEVVEYLSSRADGLVKKANAINVPATYNVDMVDHFIRKKRVLYKKATDCLSTAVNLCTDDKLKITLTDKLNTYSARYSELGEVIPMISTVRACLRAIDLAPMSVLIYGLPALDIRSKLANILVGTDLGKTYA